MDALEQAIRDAAEFGAPDKTYEVCPDAVVEFNTTPHGNPFDGMTVTHWTRD